MGMTPDDRLNEIILRYVNELPTGWFSVSRVAQVMRSNGSHVSRSVLESALAGLSNRGQLVRYVGQAAWTSARSPVMHPTFYRLPRPART
jgi:hypothetical protein